MGPLSAGLLRALVRRNVARVTALRRRVVVNNTNDTIGRCLLGRSTTFGTGHPTISGVNVSSQSVSGNQ